MNNPYKSETNRDDGSWLARAACANTEPDLFFRANTDGHARLLAERYCDRCPVAEQCNLLALTPDHTGTPYGVHGVWAGLTWDMRTRGTNRAVYAPHLTPTQRVHREQQVTDLHARGMSDVGIGRELGVRRQVIQRVRDQLGLPSKFRKGSRGAA